MQRRQFIRYSTALASIGAWSMSGCASWSKPPDKAQVVVIGGGFGGATTAKYIRWLSDHRIEVVLIEPQPQFVSCPGSNQVLTGQQSVDDLTLPYDALRRRHGVTLVQAWVSRIDGVRKQVTLHDGVVISYDKLVLSPGVDMIWDSVEGLAQAHAQGKILQAWKAGPETLALQKQLQAMPDGGVFAISVPLLPYRCPAAPYERASLIAHYFKTRKPRSKVLIFDANEDVTSMGSLFKNYWASAYAGLLEYHPNARAESVDAATGTLRFEAFDEVRADVFNVLPEMRAADLAVQAGLANSNGRWCLVNYLTFESTVMPDVHIIGDAVQSATQMAKSAHMANAQAKVVAAAIVAQLSGWPVEPNPMLTNTCYNFVSDQLAMHVASVHAYDSSHKTFVPVPGSGGVSTQPNDLEAAYARDWERHIRADVVA